MNTTIINVRVEEVTKKRAQEIAEELGLSLSSVIHGFLKQFIRVKTITFGLSDEPSEYLLQALRESKEDIKARRVSPTFTKVKESITWLNNPKRKYANQIHQKV